LIELIVQDRVVCLILAGNNCEIGDRCCRHVEVVTLVALRSLVPAHLPELIKNQRQFLVELAVLNFCEPKILHLSILPTHGDCLLPHFIFLQIIKSIEFIRLFVCA